MEPTRDWSGLIPDLLVEIAIRVESVEDFMAFRGTCTSWRAAAPKDKFVIRSWPSVPLLMLAEKEGSDEREFYSLSRRKICMKQSVPEAKGKRCIEARFGWFLTLTSSGEVNLLNPFSGAQIEVPNYKTFPEYEYYECEPEELFIGKAVLSANPSQAEEDFVLMVSLCGGRLLGFWRPRDETSWTRIESGPTGAFEDVNYYKGKFYAIKTSGNICVWDPHESSAAAAHIDVVCTMDHRLLMYRKAYLVESLSTGDLLVITRNGIHIDDHNNYGVTNFGVVRLDVMKREWEEIDSLQGGDAIFLGHNAAVSIIAGSASSSDGVIKSNCIYFSDDCIEYYMKPEVGRGVGGGEDMGIYNLKDASIERFHNVESFSFICPPLWIAPSS